MSTGDITGISTARNFLETLISSSRSLSTSEEFAMTLLEMAGVRELLRLVDVVGNLAEFCALFCEFGLRPDDLIGLAMIADLASCHAPQMSKSGKGPDRTQSLAVLMKANATQKGM